jgi:hypothetical protein
VTVGKLALITLVVLAVASLASGAPQNDKNKDGNYLPGEQTRVYQHTYDEVFQAAQEAIEREGLFVTDKDKDKGTISGNCYGGLIVFTLHIESLNTKPETQVTLNTHFTKKASRRSINPVFNVPTTIQKVLSTYH